ncbi:MAG: U32 family peptidase [Bacteroidales bacterium]|nr:U32 family peptidase [Bacteroidales bacterium]MCI7378115.1 U32 family peptidase [Bacteroidales bacterium]MDD5978795.1 U32 family peptidase [Bacteroidales bacterium]MDD7276298.1 U32 family peptidase [Bacteroidales bacterium]MDY6074727.1 peptidase U32 family protein [Bacteroidales bacterium]
MNYDDIEVMAPVGSYEALSAAIQAGAGSVYFGIGKLNMRSKSTKNFNLDDLGVISNICHENGVKSYVTVNTVVFDEEIEEMHALLDAVKANGISAVIASDQSVIQYAREIGVEVHISTQCNITNIEAVKYYSQFADVMVTARELNINQVRHITEEIERRNITGPGGDLVRIEVFCHGALCMAVSGKCYLSLDNFGTSANRGACVQPCRRGYEVTDRDKEITLAIENEYIMSPKDLCTLPFLDKVLASGVKVLKIEGRGRSPEYTKLTVSVYREAVDAVRNGTFDEEKVAAWLARLKSVYNRDFWDGYYLGRKMGEWTTKYGSQATKTKLFVGTVTNFFGKISVAEIRMETHDIKLGDEIMIIGPSTGVYEDTVREIRVDLNPVEMSVKGELCSIPTNDTVRRGDKVYKIIDANQDNATL